MACGPTTGTLEEYVRGEQLKIDRADALASVYPMWWSDCPAKLKGRFERVLTLGYATFYEEGEHRSSRIDKTVLFANGT